MMAAAQPFISGAISKTINLPNEATVEDIRRSYELSWRLGLKANALYRDGSKLSQPLNIKSDEELEDKTDAEDEDAVKSAREEVAKEVISAVAAVQGEVRATKSDNLAPASTQPIEKIIERIVERPLRRRLPDTRNAKTHKFDVQGHEGYITVGLYDDGSPGEVFITMAKEGSTIGGLMDTIATLVSVSLQYGVPVDSLVRKFEHVRFEPSGMTRNPEIPIAKSLIDYIFRWLAMEFIPGYRAANAPKRAQRPTPPPAPAPAPAAPLAPVLGGEGQGEGAANHEASKVPDLHQSRKNGNGHGHKPSAPTEPGLELQPKIDPTNPSASPRLIIADPLSQQGVEMQQDAPACDVCGSITVRSGTCYKCLNCGNSMGCS
jgi:ribonucleoside-diphosphate reductase alpha chain